MNGLVLVIDDEKEILGVIESHLSRAGYLVTIRTSGEEGLRALREEDYDLVITDLKMAGLNGIELCDRIAGNFPDLPVLILTAFGTLDVAVEAIRAGAYDFIAKPLNFDALLATVAKAIRSYKARRRVRRLDSDAASGTADPAGELLGESPHAVELRALVSRIADLDTSVLLTGESGSGKELVSKLLHKHGKRRSEPFVVVNCAAIPADSFERELFGHAERPVGGLVASAGGGTLFFDEISLLPPGLQQKLLRLLEERLYRPLGGGEEIYCPARFVAATNGDLDLAVRSGAFREDLYFRINVLQVKLRPLRERGSDVLLLAHHFLKLFAAKAGKPVRSLSEPVTEKLVGYEWPGNVRELRNAIERAVGVTEYDHLVVEDLPERIRRFRASSLVSGESDPGLVSVDEVEEKHILRVLKELNGNKALAAKVLKMDRKTLYRKLERYGHGG